MNLFSKFCIRYSWGKFEIYDVQITEKFISKSKKWK